MGAWWTRRGASGSKTASTGPRRWRLRVLGHTQWAIYSPPDGPPLDTTWQMVRDHRQQLWVATDKGLWVEQGKQFRRVLTGRILNLAVGKDDAVWATGSPGGTVHLIHARTFATRSFRIEALPATRITAGLTIDGEGRPWVASEYGEVVRGSPTARGWDWELMPSLGPSIRELRILATLSGGEVLALYDQSAALFRRGAWHPVPEVLQELPYIAAAGPDGEVVLGYKTRPALTVHRLKGEAIVRTEVLDFAATQKNLVIYSLGLGADGRIWAGTGLGLGFVNVKGPKKLRLLGSEDRIIHPECNQGALLVEPSRVWIGTPSGLMSYTPAALPTRPQLRPPVILSVRVGSRPLA